ncbi:unnamed protein product [Choristocarpus tenellus]
MLLSTVCRTLCFDRRLLLALVPLSLKPPVSAWGVPTFILSKVRAAEKAQAMVLQAQQGDGPGSSGSGSRAAQYGHNRNEGQDLDGLWKTGPGVNLPRAGDVAIRGPDWRWGEQDGGEGCRGLVVGLTSWGGRQVGADDLGGVVNAVRVMWECGDINVYRWGVRGSDGEGCFDLRVLHAPSVVAVDAAIVGKGVEGGEGGVSNSTDCGTAGSPSGPAMKKALKWSVEHVEGALLTLSGPTSGAGSRGGRDGEGLEQERNPTAREVLRFMKNNAPQEWREPRRITGAENALVKAHKPESVVRCYAEFVEQFGCNFTDPSRLSGHGEACMTKEDLLNERASSELSQLLCLLLWVTHKLSAQANQMKERHYDGGVGSDCPGGSHSLDESRNLGNGGDHNLDAEGTGGGGVMVLFNKLWRPRCCSCTTFKMPLQGGGTPLPLVEG